MNKIEINYTLNYETKRYKLISFRRRNYSAIMLNFVKYVDEDIDNEVLDSFFNIIDFKCYYIPNKINDTCILIQSTMNNVDKIISNITFKRDYYYDNNILTGIVDFDKIDFGHYSNILYIIGQSVDMIEYLFVNNEIYSLNDFVQFPRYFKKIILNTSKFEIMLKEL